MGTRFSSQLRRQSYLLGAMVLAVVSLLASVAETRTPSPLPLSFRIEPVWQISLGEGGRRRVIYRAAVCPDGSSYFTESVGRVVRLTAEGQLAFDVLYRPEVVGTLAAACAPDGTLAISTGREVVSLTHDGARFQVAGRIPLAAFALVSTGDGLLALGRDQSLGPVIWRLPATPHPDAAPQIVTVLERADWSMVPTGHLVWDGHRARIGFAPGGRYELHVFDNSGHSVQFLLRAEPTFRAHAAPQFVPEPVPPDKLIALHVLPGARYVAFVERIQGHAPNYFESRLSMEVLDDAFRLLGTVENGAAFGHPVGVASNGDLLLMHVTPDRSRLTRAKLVTIAATP
jgi:hypothetical protein